MMTSHPPHLADWLLLRLASGPRRQSLIGDLHEQHARGRSTAWYWRQTVTTILGGMASDVRRHPVGVAHALCAGLGAWVLYSVLVMSPVGWLVERIALDHEGLRTGAAIWWASIPLVFFGGWTAGRTVLRFHGERLAAALVLLGLAGVVTGLPRLLSLSLDAFGYSNYRSYLFWQVVHLTVPVVGIVIGGLSAQRSSDHDVLINDGASAE